MLLADRFDRVVATDASREQIEHAIADARIDYRVEPAERSTLDDASVDLVTVAQAAHWLRLDGFYAETRRAARRGAVIALVSYGVAVVSTAIDPIIERFFDGDLDGFWPPERRFVDNQYRDLPFPFDRIAAPRLEMLSSWTGDQMVGYIRTWSAVRAMEKSRGSTATDRFAERLAAAWGEERREVRWPLVVLAGRVP